MSKTIKLFEECLKSNWSCDEVYQKMNKISKYKLSSEINEMKLIQLFFAYVSKYFKEELESFGQLILCNDTIFQVSHKIISQKSEYKDNKFFERLELFYHTFFFCEFFEENESNDYTFYINLSEELIKLDIYEKYLFNIGFIILSQKDYSILLEALFSKDTPEFLRNIILTCFEYMREKNKKEKINYLDFLKLCVPSLNHYNLYYLIFSIKKDLGLKIPQISEIHYTKLEKYILQSNTKNIIESEHNEENNFINIKIDNNENKSSGINGIEEIKKFFNFSKEDVKNKVSEFIKPDNLEKNKIKFLQFIKCEKDKSKSTIKYEFNYDNPEINEYIINAFSFPFLLKYKLINNIDEYFFEIYNYGNKKNEIFSAQLSKYISLINKLLQNKLTSEQKLELFNNSGFYKLNNEYIFLIKVNEEESKNFFLKNNLSDMKITSINSDETFKVHYINQSDFSSNIEEENICIDNNSEEEVLYNFGNFAFKSELRTFIENYIKDNKLIYELPRLYFSLNYSIPISEGKFQFIVNAKNNGYEKLDFVLKNESEEDILIDVDFPIYKEKLFMVFQKEDNKHINNDKKIFLKKKSLIFFEFQESFPRYYWKNIFNLLFEKIKNFIDIYSKRGVYNGEYIQIYFFYNNNPDVYYTNDLMTYINNNFGNMFTNFEFGIYYFSRGISLINNQNKLNNNAKNIDNEIKPYINLIKELSNFFENNNTNQEFNEQFNELKKKFNLEIKK